MCVWAWVSYGGEFMGSRCLINQPDMHTKASCSACCGWFLQSFSPAGTLCLRDISKQPVRSLTILSALHHVNTSCRASQRWKICDFLRKGKITLRISNLDDQFIKNTLVWLWLRTDLLHFLVAPRHHNYHVLGLILVNALGRKSLFECRWRASEGLLPLWSSGCVRHSSLYEPAWLAAFKGPTYAAL